MKNLKKYSSLYKTLLKGFAIGYVTGSLSIVGVASFNNVIIERELLNEEKEKEKAKKEALNQEFESLLSTNDLEISEEAKDAINKICLAPLNMTYLDDLEITKENTALAYQEISVITNHKNTNLYEEESDSINWSEAVDVIYQNGISLEELDDGVVPMTIEEVEEQVKWIEESYNEIKSDFKNYDTKELACLLQNYSFLNSDISNGSTVASTTTEQIVFYPYYYLDSSFYREAITKHEAFHLLVNHCEDANTKDICGGIDVLNLNYDDDNYVVLASYIYNFIEEIYAELYSSENTTGVQRSYHGYDEALNLLQATLALGDNYQVDELLEKIIYKDPSSFVKNLPTFGYSKEKFLLDTLKSIKALDIIIGSDQTYLTQLKNKYPDISYDQLIRELKDCFISGLGKVYYNNLILLNEKYDLTLEDNTALTMLYWKLINNIVPAEISIPDEDLSPDNIIISPNQDLSYLLRKYHNLSSTYSDSDINDYHDIFVDYLSKKYNMGRNTVYDKTKDTSILDTNYQMPEVLGKEKQEFYQWLWEDDSSKIDLYNRKLVKTR